jgi:hypothetical protein
MIIWLNLEKNYTYFYIILLKIMFIKPYYSIYLTPLDIYVNILCDINKKKIINFFYLTIFNTAIKNRIKVYYQNNFLML